MNFKPDQKIVAMNIDIGDLLALDEVVNETAKEYNLPVSVIVFHLFRDIMAITKHED